MRGITVLEQFISTTYRDVFQESRKKRCNKVDFTKKISEYNKHFIIMFRGLDKLPGYLKLKLDNEKNDTTPR